MFACTAIGTNAQSTHNIPDPLSRGFAAIPDTIRTGHFWYWMSDNISKEGVIEDLKAMKQAGIGLAYIGFIGPSDHHKQNYPYGKVKFMTPEWWEVLHTALKTATDLGIDIGIFNSPGWSQSGGPWVKPDETMRHLAASKVEVKGSKKIRIALPKPDSLFRDVKVLAFKNVRHNLLTGDGVNVKKQADTLLIYTLPKESIVRSVMVYPGDLLKATCEIQVKSSDGIYRTVKRFDMDRDAKTNIQKGFDQRAPVAESLPETRGREFRFVIRKLKDGSRIDSLVLSPSPIVPRYPGKVFAKIEKGSAVCAVTDTTLFIQPQNVMDISRYMDADGTLTWNVPKGEWTILRTGMAPTGVKNSPTMPEASGWEADKMSKEIIKRHFRSFLGEIYKRIPANDRRCWKYTVLDSYEKGGQNITDGMIEKFKSRFGYDPTPFFPTYYGYVVGDNEMSERFLWDMRRFVADEIAYQYVAGLREISHEYGLRTWLENYGHGGFSAEFLQYGGQSDEVSGEFWHARHHAEKRAASSCAHIYGKQRVWAEAFTNDGRNGSAYAQHPAMLKAFGDDAFAQGINSMLLHVCIQQYANNDYPGVDAWFGTEFNRKNTFYSQLDLFTDYLRRCSFMLQQGRNVADVAYYISENTPIMSGRMEPGLPKGYQFDFINAEVLLRDASVKDGRLVLPTGQEYRVLVLPPYSSMRPAVLKRIGELAAAGATIVGKAPSKSPSLENYPKCDEEVRSMASVLWDKANENGISIKVGKGRIIPKADLTETFKLLGVTEDCLLDGDDKAKFAHRTLTDETEVYFITNQRNDTINLKAKFRVTGMKPEKWNPVNGTISTLPQFADNGIHTTLPLTLRPNESTFIVFRKNQTNNAYIAKANTPQAIWTEAVNTPWTVTFQSDSIHRGPLKPVVMNELSDWTKNDNDSIRYYSGTAHYETVYKLSRKPKGKVMLDLGMASVMAKVKVNDKYVGGVWTAPYSVDITNSVRKGKNKIEVEVVSTWLNRIVGDLRLPESQRRLHTVTTPWKASTKLQPSGLMGRVTISCF